MSERTVVNGVAAGQAVYTPRVLKIYDLLVHGVSNPWVWRCRRPDWSTCTTGA